MEWLNYHHLLYFWAVARHESLTQAAKELKLRPQTVSAQVKALEEALGEKLLERVGRGLKVTEQGKLVYSYADEIFALGRELVDTVQGRPSGREMKLSVGVANVLPKLVVHRLLEPAFDSDVNVRLVVHHDKTERLLAALALHQFDVVLTDSPIPPQVSVRAFNHPIGRSPVTIVGRPELARRYRRSFPASLNEAPFLLPTDDTALRRSLEQWMAREGIRPRTVCEVGDSGLLKVFGENGRGVFPIPTVVEAEVLQHYGVEVIGKAEGVVERFYAITLERKVQHPAVIAICETARRDLLD
ncbi:MAG: transcriptional activator NhaR [Planctomycetota bacterium]|jgi:LysR family transcriptional activator of nhaA